MIYIPEKLIVGFQNRTDTFDGKLSYVIYYDDKGILRKEKSWNKWRDKSIPSVEIKNEPFKTPHLNKGVQRIGYSFSSGRSMLRIYDPRGFEYEITIPNFVGIAQHCDLIKGEFSGEFVYAFEGTQLLLLPVDSEQYREAIKEQNQNSLRGAIEQKPISAKDLIPGQIFESKNADKLTYIYLGKYNINSYIGGSEFKHKASGNKPLFYVKEFKTFKHVSLGSLKKYDSEEIEFVSKNEVEEYLSKFFEKNQTRKAVDVFQVPIEREFLKKEFDDQILKFCQNSYKSKYYNSQPLNLFFGQKTTTGVLNYECYELLFPKIKHVNDMYFLSYYDFTLNKIIIKEKNSNQLNSSFVRERFNFSKNRLCEEFNISENSAMYDYFCDPMGRLVTNFKSLEKAIEYLEDAFFKIIKDWESKGFGLLMVKFNDGTVEPLKKE